MNIIEIHFVCSIVCLLFLLIHTYTTSGSMWFCSTVILRLKVCTVYTFLYYHSCTLFSQAAFNTDYIHISLPSFQVLNGLWWNEVLRWLFVCHWLSFWCICVFHNPYFMWISVRFYHFVNPMCQVRTLQNLGSADMQIIAVVFILQRLYHTPFGWEWIAGYIRFQWLKSIQIKYI